VPFDGRLADNVGRNLHDENDQLDVV
jgi:hypothetical protein